MQPPKDQPHNPTQLETSKILTKLNLRQGSELAIRKIISNSQSDVKSGEILQGKLKTDVAIGRSIIFDSDGQTSPVNSIKIQDGKYLILTQTSVYEILNSKLENHTNILDFSFFLTERGSVYKVLSSGRVQRYKTVLNDPNYIGDNMGEKPEREPSDIIIFYDMARLGSWFNDVKAIDSVKGVSISELIDVGVYVKDSDGIYRLVKNNTDLSEPFVFIRVMKDDDFKIKDALTETELRNFQQKTLKSKGTGLGVVIPSQSGAITNIPKLGMYAFDYRYSSNGNITNFHNGNKVVHIEK
jgi:hypothetical protein